MLCSPRRVLLSCFRDVTRTATRCSLKFKPRPPQPASFADVTSFRRMFSCSFCDTQCRALRVLLRLPPPPSTPGLSSETNGIHFFDFTGGGVATMSAPNVGFGADSMTAGSWPKGLPSLESDSSGKTVSCSGNPSLCWVAVVGFNPFRCASPSPFFCAQSRSFVVVQSLNVSAFRFRSLRSAIPPRQFFIYRGATRNQTLS